MGPQRVFVSFPLTACLSCALCVLCPVGLCQAAGQGAEQHSSPAPFSPDETRHGFSQRETMPLAPEETAPAPLDYYRDGRPGARRSQTHSPDGPPGGLFRRITLAHNFEEALDVRRGHLYSPVRPAETFAPETPAVYAVFRVFKHYAAYHVIGRLFPEAVPGLPATETFIDEDTAFLALEDESGYLKFFAPSQDHRGWRPGLYRIDIFAGFEANDLSRMGTMRFTIAPHD